jgi:pimeloyl-ACP methyl ester carboxylesterase
VPPSQLEGDLHRPGNREPSTSFLCPTPEKRLSTAYRAKPHPLAPKLAPDNHGLIYLPDETFAAAFAQNASADELALLSAVQRPLSPACISVRVNRPLWKDRPTWFLIAEQDRMIVHETQRFMAERMHARVRSHPVDHAPIVTSPGLVVDIIREAVGEAITG